MEENSSYVGLVEHSRQTNSFVKQCLKTAMIQMANEMDYRDISVTALCKRAGVSRMAFYRNYQVTSDIIYDLAKEINDDIVEIVGSPFRTSTTRDWYIRVFQYIKDHIMEMQLMLSESFQYQWMKIVNGYALHDPRFPAEKKYQRIMWSGGFENVTAYWLNNGMQETPEEMADYCIEYLPHLLNND